MHVHGKYLWSLETELLAWAWLVMPRNHTQKSSDDGDPLSAPPRISPTTHRNAPFMPAKSSLTTQLLPSASRHTSLAPQRARRRAMVYPPRG